jgi:type IV fimbrial biogenesis protein FimT
MRVLGGFSLVEAIVCLALVSILLGSAFPSLHDMLKRSEATSAVNWLVTAVAFTRHAAITRRVTVTLCPSRDGTACGGHWHEGIIIFTDENRNRAIDRKDKLLQRARFPVDGARLSWRSFRNRQYLQMTSEGFTNYQNGNFVYCPGDKDPRFARQLVINMQGRARTSSDIDGDGIVEDRRGRDLTCE